MPQVSEYVRFCREKLVEAPGVESAESAESGVKSSDSVRSERPFSVDSTHTGQNPDEMISAIPPGRPTLGDLLSAADRAVLAGDDHAARRLLAEALARSGEGAVTNRSQPNVEANPSS